MQQIAVCGLPIHHPFLHLFHMRGCPTIHFVHQLHTQTFLLCRLLFHIGQPSLHNAIRLVACCIETLPQYMVRHAPLVSLLPLFTQLTQAFLQFARAQFTGWQSSRLGYLTLCRSTCFRQGALYQRFGLLHQLLTQLISAPTLPALQLTGLGQRSVCHTL